MRDPRSPAVFGRRSQPHTVIIARGDHVRHFTVRPWFAGACLAVVVTLVAASMAAGTYLFLRDDIMGALAARQARIQVAYEDRIAALRAQVDRVTSRQMLEQREMENRMAELLERQSQLALRHGLLSPIIERMDEAAPALPEVAPAPAPRPERRAAIEGLRLGVSEPEITFAALEPRREAEPAGASVPPSLAFAPESRADRADKIFSEITRSLSQMETEQLEGLEALAENALATADRIAEALGEAGLEVDVEGALGGPFHPVSMEQGFDNRVRSLDLALAILEDLRQTARRVPVAHPAPGQQISSRFGIRRDPFLRRPAQHSGIDFRAQAGTPVLAAGAGEVIFAGWNGGYGRMVEIDHGDGLTTRYAHMSRIKVKKGDRLEPGSVLGTVGSSGRSTGPHLHFEVRRDGDALDPMPFIRAGRKLAEVL